MSGRCAEPLLVGRIARVAVGIGVWSTIPPVPAFDLAWLGIAALVVVGLILVIAGAIANPGCELTAPINLFRGAERRVHCWCPLFSPLDRLERAVRQRRKKADRDTIRSLSL